MLTRLHVRNFKVFEDVEIELGDSVVFVGPNNSGKTSALQALALWEAGIRRWQEQRKNSVAQQPPGVTLNRLDLVSIPLPDAQLLWRDRNTHTQRADGKPGPQHIHIEVEVEGVSDGAEWTCAMEFYYANPESFYCRPLDRDGAGARIPPAAESVHVALLPPMSGLAANEVRIDTGAVNVRIGEGRTAEVLRNLCYGILDRSPADWEEIRAAVQRMFDADLQEPRYVIERGEIMMGYRQRSTHRQRPVHLDLSSSGRGLQQTLLLLAYMYANRGAVLMLDEPDAHLEIVRQREVYRMLQERAASTGTQLLIASHSEVLLNEAAQRDVVVSFVGMPHRINDRGSQTLKALRAIGFQDYYQAEQARWVLYLEGSTDLDTLQAFAEALGHDAAAALERPFVHYVDNQFSRAQSHFHGLREAAPNFRGFALLDRQEHSPDDDPRLGLHLWKRCEIENYLCQRETLEAYAAAEDEKLGPPSATAGAPRRVDVMKENVERLEASLANLGRPSPWGPDLKVSDDFLSPLFKNYYTALGLPNIMEKKNFHVLARHVRREDIDQEVVDVLDQIAAVAEAAQPGGLA